MFKKDVRLLKKIRNALVLVVLSQMLVIAGLAIVNKNFFDFLVNKEVAQVNLQNFDKKDIQKAQAASVKNDDNTKIEPISLEQLLALRMRGNNGTPIGALSVPDVGISLPIFKGTTNQNLLYGATSFFLDRPLGQGNTVLFGHYIYTNPNLLFSPLKDAKKGQKIYLTDATNIYVYKVTYVSVIEPTDWSKTGQPDVGEKNLITLICCDDAQAERRYLVQGTMLHVTKGLKNASAEEKAALETQANQWYS
jgi:sortase A